MGQFLPDKIFPMAGLRTRASCYAQIIVPALLIPFLYVLYLISKLFD